MSRPGRGSEHHPPADLGGYRLDDQIGFVIRKASQRHGAIFMARMPEQLTPTQWAALSKVAELGTVSQNQLGRDTAMDAATIKGVVDRLIRRDLVSSCADPDDGRRSLIALTAAGRALVEAQVAAAGAVTDATLDGLSPGERQMLIDLLRRIA